MLTRAKGGQKRTRMNLNGVNTASKNEQKIGKETNKEEEEQ